jgi:hypothetical protein
LEICVKLNKSYNSCRRDESEEKEIFNAPVATR